MTISMGLPRIGDDTAEGLNAAREIAIDEDLAPSVDEEVATEL